MLSNPQRKHEDCHGVIKSTNIQLYTVQFDNNIYGEFIISDKFLPAIFDTSGLEDLI